ncbi:uncharacterized protein YkwD [Catenulispora sp. MAP12-49]
MNNAKGKVKTAAAVTSVLAVSGGVATAFHLHQDGLRNSAEAASQDSNTSAAAAAANALLAQRTGSTTAANRDMQRPTLAPSSAPTSSSSAAPTSASSSTSTTPPVPTSTSTSTPAPTTAKSETPLPSKTSTSTPTPTKTTTTPSSSSSSSSGSSTNMGYNATPAQAKAIAAAVVPSGELGCFSDIIERESSWNVFATNPSSGAYGLGQALPGDKMASMGSAWRNSALVQIKWALSYMNGRYGSPCAAWTFWQAHNWY